MTVLGDAALRTCHPVRVLGGLDHTYAFRTRARPGVAHEEAIVAGTLAMRARAAARLSDRFGGFDFATLQQNTDANAASLLSVDPAWLALVVAYRRLPVEQRTAIALHLYEGYSVEETAELMGATLETTRSRLRLGRNRLRNELREDQR